MTLARQIIVARTGVWPGAAHEPLVDRGNLTGPPSREVAVRPLSEDAEWHNLPAAACDHAEGPFDAPIPRELLYFAPGMLPAEGRADGGARARGEVRVVAESGAGAARRFRLVNAPGAPELIEIFDVAGRHIATRRLLQVDASRDGFTWNPTSLGRPVAAGLYLVRVVGNGWSAETKLRLR